MQSVALIRDMFRLELVRIRTTDEPEVHLAEVNLATKGSPMVGITQHVELGKVYVDHAKRTFHYEIACTARMGRDAALGNRQRIERDLQAFSKCAVTLILNAHGVQVSEAIIRRVVIDAIEEMLTGGAEIEEDVKVPAQAAEWMQSHSGVGDNVGGNKTVS